MIYRTSDSIEFDDDSIAEAEEQVLGTPSLVAECIMHACDSSKKPLTIKSMMISGEFDTCGLTVPQLLAAIMIGNDRQTIKAAYALRDKMVYLMRDEVGNALFDARNEASQRAEGDIA